jgi:hypothetical protein
MSHTGGTITPTEKIVYFVGSRKLPRGKWTYSRKKEFRPANWPEFQQFLAHEYGADVSITEEINEFPLTYGPQRTYVIAPRVGDPIQLLEVKARCQPDEVPHLVSVIFLAPGIDNEHAANQVYDRLQDARCDEKHWSFAVVGVRTMEEGSAYQPAPGLDSGDQSEVLLEILYGH